MTEPLVVPKDESKYLAKPGRRSHHGVAFQYKGDEVKRLQEALLAMHYKLPNFGADGKFGNETDAAVRNFQRTHKDLFVTRDGKSPPLRVDGVVGPKTALALDCALARAGIWFDEFTYEWADEDGEHKIHCASGPVARVNPKGKAKVAIHVRRRQAGIVYNVPLIPQPTKVSCWAASMAMLVSWSRKDTKDAENIVREAGLSLHQSYGWDQLEAAKKHFGFQDIAMDPSPYYPLIFPPEQWYQWLKQYGPLWISTKGGPIHAVIVHGIIGDLTPQGTTLEILDPWDINERFDNDPAYFNPPNKGSAYSKSYMNFASEFAYFRLAADDDAARAGEPPSGPEFEQAYSNWRILYIGRR
jgi:hypothetical protein